MTLALAIVARRPWWRRLVDALPWRRRALQPDADATLAAQVRAAIRAAMREERIRREAPGPTAPPPDGRPPRPPPTSLPSPGVPRLD